MRIRRTPLERFFSLLIYGSLVAAVIITLYPFLYILSMSLSDAGEVIRGRVWLLPVGFSLESYRLLFADPNVWTSLYNTVWYAVVGTLVNILFTITFAYPLSRKEFFARGFFMILTAIPLFFAGGLIPSFLIVVKLGLYNTRWAIVIPAAMSTWNVIITRVYFQSSIPDALVDAARIDGATEIGFLLRVVIPLSLPIIAVIVVFNFVGFWNVFFPALIYLPSSKLQPLQIFLQRVLINHSVNFAIPQIKGVAMTMLGLQMRYAIIIFSVAPILVFYPFLQKYFTKGYLVGALKE
jgi:ABC-type glycerol-3-phosphate transport system permease component